MVEELRKSKLREAAEARLAEKASLESNQPEEIEKEK